ncbi:MAG: hypothetical protein IT288_07610, partial [Bdellovibrionales bacterium]|nr:hypothetical protein [Bdellovibrionales bacterium]
MGRLSNPSQNLISLIAQAFARWAGLLGVLALVLGCGVRGSEKNPDGTPKGLGVRLVIVSGNDQKAKRSTLFAQPLVVQVLSPANTPVPEMTVDFRQVTDTDAQFLVGTMETPKTGIASTSVISPSEYDLDVVIEARVRNTDEVVLFNLSTPIDVQLVEFIPGFEPPANTTAHHTTPISTYKVQVRDSDNEIIIVSNQKNWITMSIVDAGQPTLLGDVQEYFTNGVATFTDTRYIKAGTYTLRATHNKTGKYAEQTITVDPGAAAQTIAVLPGQTHNTGVMTLAEAVTGSVSSLNVDSNFNVTTRAVDDYFNTDPSYGGAIAVQSPNDPNDTEPGATTFASGERVFTLSPVTAASYLIRPVSPLTDNDSSTFTMAAGTPTDVLVVMPGETFNPGQTSFAAALTGSPSNQTAGVGFTARVIATDAEFNQTTSTALASVTTSDPSDVHPTAQNLSGGAYDFTVTNVTASTPQTVTPAVGSLTVHASANYTVVHNVASQLVYTTQPANNTVAGAELAPVIEIRDGWGNLITTGPDATANVTLSLQSGTGTLGGTLTQAAVGGVASFAGLGANINLIGSKILRATKADTSGSGGTASLTRDSNSFTIVHAPASQLVFTTQPTDPTNAGSEISSVVEIRDTYGNIVSTGADATTTVSLSLQSGTGPLLGSSSMSAVGGVANFTGRNVRLEAIGAKVLRATKADTSGSGGTATITQDASGFTVIHGPADHLTITTQPADPVVAGAEIAPVVEVRDQFNNVVSTGADATANVTLSLQSGTGTLSGTLVKAAVAGVADFSGLGANINLVGAKVIRITKADTSGSGGTTSKTVDTNSFTVIVAPASQLVFTTQPADPTVAGANLLPVIQIRDVYGNVVTSGVDATANVTLSLQSGTGALGGTLTKAAAAGVVTFTAGESVDIDIVGAKTLRASKADTTGGGGTGVLTQDSNSFNIVHAPAATLVYTTQPADPTVAGANLLPVVEIRDAYTNVVTSGADATVTLTMSLQSGTGSLLGTVAKAASGGVVSFTATEAMNIRVSGTKTLRATKADTSGSGGTGILTQDSANFTINPAPASQLVYTTQPASPTVAGANLLPVIEIRDPYNNVITGGADATASVTLSLVSGTGALGGTVSVSAVAGVASFGAAQAVNIQVSGAKTLRATKADTSGGGGTGTITQDSSSFNIVHAPATQLVFTTEPTNPSVAGFEIAPVVEVQDTYGNRVISGADAIGNVTFTIQSGSGTLGGTTSKVAAGGVVDMAGLAMTIDLIGGKILRATKADTTGGGGTASVFEDSLPFSVISGIADRIVFTTPPSDPTTSAAEMPVVLEIQDSLGNRITSGVDSTPTVTLNLQSGTGTLGGTVSMSAVAGIADFTGKGVNIDLIGNKVIRATKADTSGSGGTAAKTVDSSSFTVAHAAASQLVFTTQPSNPTTAGANLLPVIEIRDAQGNLVTSGADATANVTLSLQSGTGALSGTLTKAAVGGVATFTATEAVSINLVGSKTLRASKADTSGGGGTGVITQDSNSFTINHAAANSLAWTTQPATGAAGTNLTPVVEIRDSFGNVVTSDSASTITLTIQTNPGSSTLAGDVDLTVSAGVATWTATQAMYLNKVGTGYILRASDGTRTADSSAFNVTHATANSLAWTTQPATGAAGTNLTPVVEIRDAYANVVTSDSTSVITLTIQANPGSSTLAGDVDLTVSSGVATWTGAQAMYLNKVGTGYVLRASDGSRTADSSAFNVTHATANSLAWTTQPATGTAGTNLTPVVEIRDAYGNVTTTDNASVITLTIQTNPGSSTLAGDVDLTV